MFEPPTDEQIAAVADAFAVHAARCGGRDYPLEAIEMFLVIENLARATAETTTDTPTTDDTYTTDAYGERLARAAQVLLERLLNLQPTPTVRQLRLLSEVLAERFFVTPPLPFTEDVPPLPPEEAPPLLLPGSWRDTFASLLRGLQQGRYLRVLNVHNTIADDKRLAVHLERLARHFSAVSEADLAAFSETGVWPKPRPGAMVVLFEGFRDHYRVALPLLEAFGLTAWFYIVPGFIDTPVSEQYAFARAHNLRMPQYQSDPGERLALSWDELREIRERGHVIAAHTMTHSELTSATPEAVMKREIIGCKTRLETMLDIPIGSFAWLRGSEYGLNPRADQILLEAGYQFLVSNFKIQRLPR